MLKTDEEKLNIFLQMMVRFSSVKGIERLFVNLQNPTFMTSNTVDVFVNVLAAAPDDMEICLIAEVPQKGADWYGAREEDTNKQLPAMFRYVKQINDKARACGVTKQVTCFAEDGENNGGNSAQYCDWYHYATQEGFKGDELTFLQAKGASLNAEALFHAATKDNDGKCDGLQPSQIEARGEYYWYLQELKEENCIGCPTYIDHVKDPQQCTSEAARKQNRDDKCTADPHVGEFMTFIDFAKYGQCMEAVKGSKGQSDEACCKCAGCVQCKWDQHGNLNDKMLYMKYKDQPLVLADKVAQLLTKWTYFDSIKSFNTAPMGSIEVSHDQEDTHYLAGTNDKDYSCMTRRFVSYFNVEDGKVICGTFNGHGIMTWDNYITFIDELMKKLKSPGTPYMIYEWQFIPPQWLEQIDFTDLLPDFKYVAAPVSTTYP